MYKTQVYSDEKLDRILYRIAKKRNRDLQLWIVDNDGFMICKVVARPYDFVTALSNVFFVGNYTIEPYFHGFKIQKV